MPDELTKLDPREPFLEDDDPEDPLHDPILQGNYYDDDSDECDTCVGTPNSHVCRRCKTQITGAQCEENSGLCAQCYLKGRGK